MLRISTKTRRVFGPSSLIKHLTAIVAALIIAGCSGGGCSSCGGVTPLPNGFEANARVENAASVRLTRSGLDFLEANLGTLASGLLGGMGNGGLIEVPIPTSTGMAGPLKYTICPSGADPNNTPKICTAEIDVGSAKLKIDPSPPYDLHITGTLPIRVQDLEVQANLGICDPILNVSLNGNSACPGGNFDDFPVDADIAIHVDQNPNLPSFGYTRIDVTPIIDHDQAKAALESSLNICGKTSCDAICCISDPCTCALAGVLNIGAVKSAVAAAIEPQLSAALKAQIEQAVCPKANPSCLGTGGHIDLGGLLSGISPGTRGGLDFLLAAGGPSVRDDNSGFSWGDLNPINSGVTLGMYGGAEPVPLSKCVKLSTMPMPTAIPMPTELLGNTVTGWPAGTPGPHVGIALSERFTNYAMNGVYNSGLLCIGISTENIPLLNSGTLGLLAASSKDLGIQRETQQVALVVRPSTPPTVTFGNGTDIDMDPVLRVKLNQAAFDFYFFSLDRYMRFMTATFDLDVPVNLTVTPMGLLPVVKKIGVTNGKVTNNELIREDPNTIAAALADLIASQVGQAVGGGINPIDLDSALASLGLKLIIPDSVAGQGSPGLRKLSKGSDNYLGIFAALDVAMPFAPAAPTSETSAELLTKMVDPKGLKLTTISPDNIPVISLKVGSSSNDGARAMEYQYRLDQGFWTPFTRERFIDIRDAWMRIQGKHVIQVRSRVVGEPMSLDPSPAEVEVVVDVDPPAITLGKVEGGKIALNVKDLVSERALVRVKLDSGKFTPWTQASELTSVDIDDAAEIAVEAKDEEGNIATATQELIRGRADAPAGCGCAVVGGESTRGAGLFALGAAIFHSIIPWLRRRRRSSKRNV